MSLSPRPTSRDNYKISDVYHLEKIKKSNRSGGNCFKCGEPLKVHDMIHFQRVKSTDSRNSKKAKSKYFHQSCWDKLFQ